MCVGGCTDKERKRDKLKMTKVGEKYGGVCGGEMGKRRRVKNHKINLTVISKEAFGYEYFY